MLQRSPLSPRELRLWSVWSRRREAVQSVFERWQLYTLSRVNLATLTATRRRCAGSEERLTTRVAKEENTLFTLKEEKLLCVGARQREN